MLLKTLILVVIAWFVLRAARNLIKAVTHDQGRHQPHSDSSGPQTIINRHGRVERDERERPEENVEDAKFRDL